MDTLDPEKRRLVMAALQEQESRIRLVKSGWRWWEIGVFLVGWAGFAWFQHQGMQADLLRPESAQAPPVPFHVVASLIAVPVVFLLVYIHALHRRVDALIGLLGEKTLTARAVGEIRAIKSGTEEASGVPSDDGDPP